MLVIAKQTMNNVNEIKEAIARLPEDELASLIHWFEEFDTEKWDKQFEDDVQSGKLDRVAYQSCLSNHRNLV